MCNYIKFIVFVAIVIKCCCAAAATTPTLTQIFPSNYNENANEIQTTQSEQQQEQYNYQGKYQQSHHRRQHHSNSISIPPARNKSQASPLTTSTQRKCAAKNYATPLQFVRRFFKLTATPRKQHITSLTTIAPTMAPTIAATTTQPSAAAIIFYAPAKRKCNHRHVKCRALIT